MSWKSELAEVLDWLTDLADEGSTAATSVPLPRDDWQRVMENLQRAAEKFESAAAEYDRLPDGDLPVAADLALDLRNEAQALADRAYILGRRARPKTNLSTDELTLALETKTESVRLLDLRVEKLRERVAELEGQAPEDRVRTAKRKRHTVQRDPKRPGLKQVQSGRRTLTTARTNLFSVSPPEVVVVEFAEDLDVLVDLVDGWIRYVREPA